MSELHELRRKAERMRNEWILSLHSGYITTADLIKAACTDDHRPLRRLTLRRVLANQPGWGNTRAVRATNHILNILGLEAEKTPRLTVNWLLDARASGRRVQAFVDCLETKDQSPWLGFPFAPNPTRGAANG